MKTHTKIDDIINNSVTMGDKLFKRFMKKKEPNIANLSILSYRTALQAMKLRALNLSND